MCICEMGIIKKNGNILKKTKKKQKKGSNNSSLRRVWQGRYTDNTNSCWQCLQNKTEEKQQRVYTNRKNVDGQQPFVEVVFGGRKGQNTKRNKHFSLYPPLHAPYTKTTVNRRQRSLCYCLVFFPLSFLQITISSHTFFSSSLFSFMSVFSVSFRFLLLFSSSNFFVSYLFSRLSTLAIFCVCVCGDASSV
jgi:hypothetical protein